MCDMFDREFSIEDFDNYDQIFIGKVISFEDIDNLYANYTYEIKENFKGDSSKFISIITGYACCVCGYNFENNQHYLVFANNGETNSCTLTTPLDFSIYDKLRNDTTKLEFQLNDYDKKILLNLKEIIDILEQVKHKNIKILRALKLHQNGFLKTIRLNGKINSKSHFKNGFLHGIAKYYYPNGYLKAVYHYKNGVKHGKAIEFEKIKDKNPVLIKHRGKYYQNKKQGIWKYKTIKGSYKNTSYYSKKSDKGTITYPKN